MTTLRTPTPDQPFRFVALGECMVEMAPSEAAGQFRMGFAGDTFNTIWYLRQLCPAWDTSYVTRVGTDAVSGDMLAMMQATGINTSHIGQATDRSVGLYLISLQDGERSFSYWRDRSAARHLAADPAALSAAMAGADLIYASGITLAILEDNGRDNLLAALDTARKAGATVAFDSNLRPRLWPSTAALRDAVMAAAAVSDIVLPSYDDEVVYFGDTSPQATLDRYLATGATTVVVKNGAGEVLYQHNGSTGTYRPKAITKVVDTTAAGDSFNAGFFAGLAATGDMKQAIGKGADVAAKVISHRGALVPLT